MSREIKFRFFRTKVKEMVYGFKGCSLTYVLDMWENEKHVSKPMQYTGLSDKNGVEIYEGDIVACESNGINRYEERVVCYDSNQAKYKTVPMPVYRLNTGNGGWTGYDLRWYCEVVGNIYENEELIK